MAQASEELELAWRSLDQQKAAEGWQSIDVACPFGAAWRAGRRWPTGEETFLVRFPHAVFSGKEALPQGQGFLIERVTLPGDAHAWVALSRKAGAGVDLFLAMVQDVSATLIAQRIQDGPETLGALLRRVRAWQEFMRKAAGPLSAEQEVGLFGELVTLEELISHGVEPVAAVQAWLGPTREGVQDFELGPGAIEAKTTLSPAGFPARIGSLAQLDDSFKQPIYLAAVRLHQAKSGRSLNDLVHDIRARLTDHEGAVGLFLDRLVEAGYLTAHAPLYIRRFTVSELRLLPVTVGFPRLTKGSVPPGVIEARYQIEIDGSARQATDFPSALKTLGVVQA